LIHGLYTFQMSETDQKASVSNAFLLIIFDVDCVMAFKARRSTCHRDESTHGSRDSLPEEKVK
jgi:hypothetical protein